MKIKGFVLVGKNSDIKALMTDLTASEGELLSEVHVKFADNENLVNMIENLYNVKLRPEGVSV